MNKKIFKSILLIGVIIITSLLLTTVSNATLTISTSKSTVSPGESFNVTVSVGSNEAGAINLSASNGTLSQTYVDLMSQSSLTISCVAGSSGTITISGSGLVANYASETEGTQSASKSVIIKQPTPTTPTTPNTPSTPTTKPSTNTTTKPAETKKSDNSNLSALQIAEGVITPEFNKKVKEYSINVPNEITKLSIVATPEHSKATVKITGNEELQVGENNVEIVVTAEDGSTDTYKIIVTRALPELNLQTLSIYYIDENNQKVEIKLEPQFVFNTYEYKSLEKLSYTVKELQVDATANRENAKIEIIGNEKIKAGKNEITIKVTLPNEEGLEEQKTYKITIEREDEPVIVPLTTMQKMKNWFSGVGASVGGWITANFDKLISGMLLIATASFVGLTIYFAYDYKNYQRILAKLAEYNKENLNQRAAVALKPKITNANENIESIKIAQKEETNNDQNANSKPIKGRRFK